MSRTTLSRTVPTPSTTTRARLLASAALTVSALALTACAESGDDTASAPTTSASATSAESGAASPTGPDAAAPAEVGEPSAADVMFSRMMIPHHEQAIEMSDIILAKSDIAADVTALAEKIKAEQGPEIEQMQAWLDQWDQPTGPRDGRGGPGGGMATGGDNMPMRGDMPMGGDMPMMDGMLSGDEIRQLSDAEGTAAARLFLEQMIAHHEGAIDMAQREVDGGTYQPTIDLARSIIDTQRQEITTMRDMLSAM